MQSKLIGGTFARLQASPSNMPALQSPQNPLPKTRPYQKRHKLETPKMAPLNLVVSVAMFGLCQ